MFYVRKILIGFEQKVCFVLAPRSLALVPGTASRVLINEYAIHLLWDKANHKIFTNREGKEIFIKNIVKFCWCLSHNVQTNKAIINLIVHISLSIWKKMITEIKCSISFDCKKETSNLSLLTNNILFINS